MYNNVVEVVQNCFKSSEFIPLHEPRFIGNEKTYLNECIDSTFVSSVGEFVDRFEDLMCQTTGAEFAVATVNGTSALHIALILAGVEKNSEVITQALTFVATANAISYIGAETNFVDVDKDIL
jgi:perosamine synthetase